MKFDKSRVVTWILLLFILVGLFNIYTLIKDRDEIYKNMEANIFSKISNNLPIPKDGKDGYTPQKGVDYFDGRDGRDGRDGKDGRDGIDGQPGAQGIQGEPGVNGTNGQTPQLRCNTKKNQWEVRYSETESWQLLNNEKVKCTVGL